MGMSVKSVITRQTEGQMHEGSRPIKAKFVRILMNEVVMKV